MIGKASAVCFSLTRNHPFVDGNKRIAHLVMEFFLERNGCLFEAPVDEAEQVILGVAAGQITREELTAWVADHIELSSS